MKLIPVNDKIVVKPRETANDEMTESGIILPDTVSDGKLVEADVISVGEGMYSANGTRIPVVVKEGDVVLYNKTHNGASEYTLNGEEVLIMSQNEVLSILRSE
tara:strand:+ start:3577 stop:3885 length:309 start_codon:yes stop_codon:yes gene_type:complete